MASGGGTLGTAARKLKRAVRDLKSGVKGLQGEARETVRNASWARCRFGLRSVCGLGIAALFLVVASAAQVGSFGPWVQQSLAKVEVLAEERTAIAQKARDNYKKEYKQRKQIYKELVAKQEELGEPIEPTPQTDSDED